MGRRDLRRVGRGHQEAGRDVRHHQARRAESQLGAGAQCLRRAIQPHGGCAAGDDRQYRQARRLRRGRRQGLACRGRWPIPTTNSRTSGTPRSSPTAGRISCSTIPMSPPGGGAVAAFGPVGRRGAQHSRDLLAGLRLVQPAHQHQQGDRGDPQAGLLRRGRKPAGVHGFDHHPHRDLGRLPAARSPPISNATTSRCPGTRGTTTSTGRR